MSEHGSQQPRPAYCEEYSEETQATVPETRQSANVAAKILPAQAATSTSTSDAHSDSGYSSHTHSAPNSSLDSKLGAQPPAAPDPPKPVAEASTKVESAPHSRAPSPDKKTLKRTDSKSRRHEDPRSKDCHCQKCLARRAPVYIDPYRSTNYAIAQPRQKTPAPPSPQARRPAPLQETIHPPREHARPRPAVSRQRPMSFHAGTMPEPMFFDQSAYIIERQPSARQTAYPFAPPPAFPVQPTYFEPLPPPQPQPLPAPPPQPYYNPAPVTYEMLPPARPRPPPTGRGPSRPRPQTMYHGHPPIFEQPEPRYHLIEPRPELQRQLSRRGRRESLRQAEAKADLDAQMMPPPPPPSAPPKPRQEQRPPMRHAATSTAATSSHQGSHNRGSHDGKDPTVRDRSSRKGSVEEQPRSRRPSAARATKISDEKVVTFDDVKRDLSRMTMEPSPSKSRRRSSVYGHESLKDLEGSIEAYQESKGTLRSPVSNAPSHDEMMARLMRTKNRPDSESGSRVSAQSRGSKGSRGSRDGSEVKPPSTSNSKALEKRPGNDGSALRSENDRFALRFNPNDTNVKMQGGIEGGAFSIRRSKEVDGDMELSFEPRGNAAPALPEASGNPRGRLGSAGSGSTGRPPLLRERSRKRYSYIEGRGVQEISGPGYEASRSLSVARLQESLPDNRGAPRIVGERIITTTRSRRSSQYGYERRERYEG